MRIQSILICAIAAASFAISGTAAPLQDGLGDVQGVMPVAPEGHAVVLVSEADGDWYRFGFGSGVPLSYALHREGESNTIEFTDLRSGEVVRESTFPSVAVPELRVELVAIGDGVTDGIVTPSAATVTTGCALSNTICATTIVNDNYGPVYHQMTLDGPATNNYRLYGCEDSLSNCGSYLDEKFASSSTWYSSSVCKYVGGWNDVTTKVTWGTNEAYSTSSPWQWVWTNHYC